MASAQPIPPGASARNATREPADEPLALTLLELVRVVSECTRDDREVVATVRYMLRNRRVRLTGCFRDEPLESS